MLRGHLINPSAIHSLSLKDNVDRWAIDINHCNPPVKLKILPHRCEGVSMIHFDLVIEVNDIGAVSKRFVSKLSSFHPWSDFHSNACAPVKNVPQIGIRY